MIIKILVFYPFQEQLLGLLFFHSRLNLKTVYASTLVPIGLYHHRIHLNYRDKHLEGPQRIRK